MTTSYLLRFQDRMHSSTEIPTTSASHLPIVAGTATVTEVRGEQDDKDPHSSSYLVLPRQN